MEKCPECGAEPQDVGIPSETFGSIKATRIIHEPGCKRATVMMKNVKMKTYRPGEF